ncbi:MAG TPA: hypothetical protein VGM75_08310 [Pseudonocardiaceae bacterium]
MAILAVPADIVELYAVSIALTGAVAPEPDEVADADEVDVDGVAGEPDVLAVPHAAIATLAAAMTAAQKPTRTGRTFCLPQLV